PGVVGPRRPQARPVVRGRDRRRPRERTVAPAGHRTVDPGDGPAHLPVPDGPPRGAPVRHLVAYHGNRYLDHFARDLDEIREWGFTGIVHCATETDLEWGVGRLADIFGMTAEAGLECWADPWGVGGV